MPFKICPMCGHHNPPTAFDCEDCFADLTSVPMVDEEPATEEKAPAAEPVYVRVCPACGHVNPANARKCGGEDCGEDISDVVPTVEAEKGKTYAFELEGGCRYEIAPGVTVIGKEHEMREYMEGKSYVSREHAEITLADGKLTLRNLSRTNYTYINNVRCVAECVELRDGDDVGLGGNRVNGGQEKALYFTVRIG